MLSDDSSTIFKAGLCPAAKLYFSSEAAAPFLRAEIVALEGKVPEADIAKQQSQNSRETDGSLASRPTEYKERPGRPAEGEKKVPKWMQRAKK